MSVSTAARLGQRLTIRETNLDESVFPEQPPLTLAFVVSEDLD